MKHFYEDIQGMMDYEDLYADMVKRFKSGSKFVELGVWYGRSSAFMCTEIVNSEKYIEFYAVDNFAKSPIESAQKLEKKFDFYHVIKNNSAHAAMMFKNESIDFVFVDADHSAHGVSMDILAWLPKIRKGGIIAGHDYENERYPELKIAVDQLLPRAKKTSKMCWIYEV